MLETHYETGLRDMARRGTEAHEGIRDVTELHNGARRTTLKDIANSLGLSANTVSRALAGKDAVNEGTRARIQAEAERLGYVPNAMARSLVVGSTMSLGLVITNPSNPFYARLISAIEQRCRQLGYAVVLMVTEENIDTEARAARSLLRSGVDGAIVVPVQDGSDHWRRLTQRGLPLVLVNRDLDDLDCDFVGLDYEGSAYRATCHLLEHNRRQVFLVEEDLQVSSVQDRIHGFRRALREHGMADDAIIRVPTRRRQSSTLPWDPEDAYILAKGFATDLAPGTAILAGSDYFALGIYRALQEAGRDIPSHVAVMGYGDHPFSAYLNPPLSSVRLPAAEIGTEAVNILLRRIADPKAAGASRRSRLEPTLMLRHSTPGA